ncbi:MAG: hypothetical protein J0L75_05200 [Spirochaetes bacterium]|nr:hypothetical protein [Spirochaetota bacterium]
MNPDTNHAAPRALRLLAWVPFALAFLLLALSLVVNHHNGIRHMEANWYFGHYLDPHSGFLSKIFNVVDSDASHYFRAREVSTLFNYLDTQLVFWGFAAGFPHLLSLVHYLALALLVVAYGFFARTLFGNRGIFLSGLLLLAYLSSPSVFFTGFYFRTGKTLVALLMVVSAAFLLGLWRTAKDAGPADRRHFVAAGFAFLLGASLGLLDEIGLAYLGVITGFLALQLIVQRPPRLRASWIGLVAALAFVFLYRSWLGPMIVRHFVAGDQSLWTVGGGAKLRLAQLIPNLDALRLFLSYFGMMLGNLPPVPALAAVGLACAVFVKGSPWDIAAASPLVRWSARLSAPAAQAAMAIAAILVILQLMALQHKAILWEDVIRIYYAVPFGAVFLLGLSAALAALLADPRVPAWPLAALLSLALCLNLVALPGHRTVIAQGHLSNTHHKLEFLKREYAQYRAAHPDQSALEAFNAAIRVPER